MLRFESNINWKVGLRICKDLVITKILGNKVNSATVLTIPTISFKLSLCNVEFHCITCSYNVMIKATVKQVISVSSNTTSRVWTDLTLGQSYVFTVSQN